MIKRCDKINKKRVPSEMTTLLSELETMIPTGQDVQKEIEDREIAVHISAFLRNLEPEKRAIFIRRYWYCDEITKIALDFECSESKIKASLFRMREKLKLYLEKERIMVYEMVELVYYMSFIDDYKPYYRFWVEVPEEKQENGLNTYVAYYVPAVEMAYLDIAFN